MATAQQAQTPAAQTPAAQTPAAQTAGTQLSSAQQLCELMGIAFSDQQLAAITAPLEPAVIIAGAGSGKTTVMAARVVWLVGTGQVRPDQVLGLTFTRKAAGELASRVRRALLTAGVLADGADDQGEEVVMTYDAFARRVVAEHGQRIGEEPGSTLISGAARYRLASRVVRATPGPLRQLSRLRPNSLVELVLKLDAMMSSHLVTAEQITAHAHQWQARLAAAPLNRGKPYAIVTKALATSLERLELLAMVADFRTLKASLGVTEFADQMAIAARLAAEVPQVGSQLRHQYRVVLLDEYQDTSSAQAQLLADLFTGATPAQGLGHAVTAVGDPFQAIYGWRGAAASNILAFKSRFLRTDEGGTPREAAAYQLTVNRRSGQHILDVANEIAAGLRSDPVLTTHDPSGSQTPGRLVAPEDRDPGSVTAARFDTWPDEVAWVADRIVRLHRERPEHQWRDVAVLLRRNAALPAIYRALVEREVPVEIVGLGGLLTLPAVADVVSTLRLINDVTANPDVVRLVTGPRWRIGARDLAILGKRARRLAGTSLADEQPLVPDLHDELAEAVADTDPTDVVSLLDAMTDLATAEEPFSDQARERLIAFAAELAHLRRYSAEPVLDQVRRVIATLNLDVELRAGGRSHDLEQLSAFVDAVADYVDVDDDASLAGLLAYLQAELDHGVGLEQATPSAADSVKVMTVHRAKGLEWEWVYVPALVDQVFPSLRVTDNWLRTSSELPAELRGDADSIAQVPAQPTRDDLESYPEHLKAAAQLAEDRLAYVAITRARTEVVVSSHVWQQDLKRPRLTSAYFDQAQRKATALGRVEHMIDTVADEHPLPQISHDQRWPIVVDTDHRDHLHQAAAQVRSHQRSPGQALPELGPDDAALVQGWRQTLAALEREQADLQQRRQQVTLPGSMSVTAALKLARDPQAELARIARPMPQQPSTGALVGTAFHAWLERRLGQNLLFDPDEGDERSDMVASVAHLGRLKRAFEESAWSDRVPVGVEVPFVLAVPPVQLRGQIDAVYQGFDDAHDWVLVDWKTGTAPADQRQLAVYRLAWARAQQVPVERVASVFVHLSTGEEVWSSAAVDEAELLALLTAGPAAG